MWQPSLLCSYIMYIAQESVWKCHRVPKYNHQKIHVSIFIPLHITKIYLTYYTYKYYWIHYGFNSFSGQTFTSNAKRQWSISNKTRLEWKFLRIFISKEPKYFFKALMYEYIELICSMKKDNKKFEIITISFLFIYLNMFITLILCCLSSSFISLVIHSFFILFYCREGSIIADFAVNVCLFRADTNSTQIGNELKEKTKTLSENGSLGDVQLTKGYIENYTFDILNNGMYHS